jgi:hypothetical protein
VTERSTFHQLLAGGVRGSVGARDEAVKIAIRQPARLGELFSCVLATEPEIALRAASAFDLATQEYPERARPFHDDILAAVDQCTVTEARWHLLHLLGRLEFPTNQRAKIVQRLCIEIDGSKSRLAAVNALQAVAELADRYHDVLPEARRIALVAKEHSAASVRARARILSTHLDRTESN